MKHLYAINILTHPYLKDETQVKNLFNTLKTTNSWIVNSGESYIIRRTLSGSWVWDKMTRDPVDLVGRLYDNHWVEKFNHEKLNENFYEVGRNPNKGFLMINNTLWGLCEFDISMKGRKLKRLNIPNQIINDISNKLGFEQRKPYNTQHLSSIYYVDNLTFHENLQSLSNNFNELIVNFDESFKIPIYISKHKNNDINNDYEEK